MKFVTAAAAIGAGVYGTQSGVTVTPVGGTGSTVLPPAAKGEPAAEFRIDPEDDIVVATLVAQGGAVTRKA